MRIIGGALSGRKIRVPGGKGLRPSTDKIRGAIFSVLGDDITGAKVADLFCGSGALGLEALSRGADRGLFVDSSKKSISAVRWNIKELELQARSEVKLMDVLDISSPLLENVSIIFADPPYRESYGDKLISLLSLKKFAYHGIITIEHESEWSYRGSEFRILKRIEFGDSSVSFLLGK
jgi:16S rRNA (guanine(966)-N(2))-methyltransferase RsmD